MTRPDRIRKQVKPIEKDSMGFINRETGLLLCRRAGIDVTCVGSNPVADAIIVILGILLAILQIDMIVTFFWLDKTIIAAE